MAGGGVAPIAKSRYDSISCYLFHGCSKTAAAAGGVLRQVQRRAVRGGRRAARRAARARRADAILARHIAHLFCRDPLVIFEGAVAELDDAEATEHWENLQSTNWRTMRWKPPPTKPDRCSPHIGWRVEFRSMEVQLTDYENAAFAVTIVLLTRVILAFDLHLLMPLSLVDENMDRAHGVDACAKAKFWWRMKLVPDCERCPSERCSSGRGGAARSPSRPARATLPKRTVDATGSPRARPRARSRPRPCPTTKLPDGADARRRRRRRGGGVRGAGRRAAGGRTTTSSCGRIARAHAPPRPSPPYPVLSLSPPPPAPSPLHALAAHPVSRARALGEQMTLAEIMTGKGDYYPGLVTLARALPRAPRGRRGDDRQARRLPHLHRAARRRRAADGRDVDARLHREAPGVRARLARAARGVLRPRAQVRCALGRGEDAEARARAARKDDASKAPRLRVEHAYDKPLSARRVDPSTGATTCTSSVYVRRAREPLGPSQNLRIAPLLSPPSGTSTASRSRAAATAVINDIDEMIAAATAAGIAAGRSG